MTQFIDQISRLLVNSQGNLIHFLVLVILILGAYQGSLYASRGQPSTEAKRMQNGMLLLLLTQLILLVASWTAVLGIVDERTFLPPMERTGALFSLGLVAWLWAFPRSMKLVDELLLILEAGLLAAGVIGFTWWFSSPRNMSFVISPPGAYAYYLGILFILGGMVLMLWRRPSGWGFGIAMLTIQLIGYAAQYFISQPAGDYPLYVRLGEMAGYILLLTLPRRLITRSMVTDIRSRSKYIHAHDTGLDSELVDSILDLGMERRLEQYYQKLTVFFAKAMKADVCLTMMAPRVGEQIIVTAGAIRGEIIEGFTLDGHMMPQVLEAIKMEIPIQVDSSNNEVQYLVEELGSQTPGQLLAVPFKNDGANSGLSVLVLSRPDQPMWSEKEETQLIGLLKTFAAHGHSSSAKFGLESLPGEGDRYRKAYLILKAQYDELSNQSALAKARLENASAAAEGQKKLEERVYQLERRNQELENLIARNRTHFEEAEQLRMELRSALEDLARVPTTLSKSDQHMLELQLSAMNQVDEMGQSQQVRTLAQEFRQPLSAIMGYTDLLLGESAGLLGAVQRRFIERVKASTERMSILLKELGKVVEVVADDTGQVQASVEIKSVVDEEVSNINRQAQEKKIAVQVELPSQLPPIQVNGDMLGQIVSNMLQNAWLATPEGGEITLSARVEQEQDEPQYLLISVTDQGGGIAKTDIRRVFSRRYKADNPAIKGTGDTGVSLSIVKALVEMQKGRIWVDAQEGIGSTISVIIPIGVAVAVENNPPEEIEE